MEQEQPQIMSQNPNNPQENQIENQNISCQSKLEKITKCIIGTEKITSMVAIILMLVLLTLITNISFPYNNNFSLAFSSLGNFLFTLFVWSPMAVKIEKITSSVRYGCLFLINCSLLCVLTLAFPLYYNRFWCFIFFETLLIALSNINKKMRFFSYKLKGIYIIAFSIAYILIFNYPQFYYILIIVIYTIIYKKYLINKFAFSNERMEKIENKIINWTNFSLIKFIYLKDTLEMEENIQHEKQNSDGQISNNSSFIPNNMYPNHDSGIENNGQQMEQNSKEEPIINNEPNINQIP